MEVKKKKGGGKKGEEKKEANLQLHSSRSLSLTHTRAHGSIEYGGLGRCGGGWEAFCMEVH